MACSLVALACGACSLFVDLSTDQCQSDTDCLSLGAKLTCNAGTCIDPSANTQIDSGGSDGGDDAGPPCQSNAQCIDDNFGEPYICDKTAGSTTLGRCVSVKQNGCAFVLPESELRNDNAVVFGAFIPLNNQAAPLSQPIALAYKLALEEIQKAGGLPAGTGGQRRPLVSVLCDSDPLFVQNGVKHLTAGLHVPAVISLFSQTDMTTFFQDYLRPTGTFTLNPQDTTEALKGIEANRLLWHLLGTPEDVARAYRPLIERAETHVKNKYGVTPPVRVALLAVDAPTEESIAAIIRDPGEKGIRFNGKNCDDNGANFFYRKIPSRETEPGATYGTFVDEVAAFGPDIVILLTSNQEVAALVGSVDPSNTALYVPGLDAKMKSVDGGTTKPPFYVLGPRNARNAEFLTYLNSEHTETKTKKVTRFVGLQYAGAEDKANPQSQYQQFLKRFADENPTALPSSYSGVDNYYDAIYWLAYGMFAAGPGAPVRGSSFSDGVRKLVSGPEIYPGSKTQISAAFQSISISTDGTTFVGALGKPDFDTATGAQKSVGAVYCYEQDPNDSSFKPKYDTLRYKTGTLEAPPDTSFCFIGF